MQRFKLPPLTLFFFFSLVLIVFAKMIFVLFGHAYLKLFAIAFLVCISLTLIILALIFLGRGFAPSSISNEWNRKFIFIQCLFWSVYLCIIYPGFYNYDSYSSLQAALEPTTEFWQSHIYGFLCYCSLFINRHLFALPMLNVLLWLGCLFFIIFMAPLQSIRQFFLVTILSLLPLQLATLPFIIRDTLFGVLSCVLVLLLLPFIKNPKKIISNSYYLGTLFILILACEVRQDGSIYYLLFPLLLWLTASVSLRQKIPLTICLCAGMIVLNSFLTRKESPSTVQNYQFTAILHPLNAIFYNPNSIISVYDSAIVAKVIDPLHLKNRYNHQRISQFHEGLDKLPVSASEWAEFQKTYLNLAKNNLGIFFRERFEVFRTTFGFVPGDAYIFSDEIELPPQIFIKEMLTSQMPAPITYLVKFRRGLLYIINGILNLALYIPLIGITLLNPLFFLVVAYFVSRKNRETTLLFKVSAALLIGRSVVIFFAVPEPHLTYYAPVIYLTILCIIYSILSPSPKKQIAIKSNLQNLLARRPEDLRRLHQPRSFSREDQRHLLRRWQRHLWLNRPFL